MSRPRLIHIESVGALRDAAPQWDDLWWRSDVARPTVRAELLAQWVEQFAPGARLHALAVEEEGRLVAALPLVPSLKFRWLKMAGMPSNEWSPAGDLLLDAAADAESALDLLVAAMRQLPWRLLWLNHVPLAAPRWQALAEAAGRARVSTDWHEHRQEGRIEIRHDLQAFDAGLSKKHRTKMARCTRRIAERGEVRLEVMPRFEPGEVEPWLRRALEIEDRGWKGESGTSVLRSPGMFAFYLRQAQTLAAWGQLELAFLYCGEVPVSFIYGYAAKGVAHWQKIGYDPQFAACTPGQVLQWHLLRRFQEQPEREAVDTMGPVDRALAQWRPVLCPVGRLAIGPGRLLGRWLVYACKRWGPCLRRLRSGAGADARQGPGAEVADPESAEPVTA